ncbi:response regulator [Dyadobacter sp. CY345]|uniref:response regulator n=1 Tax=Dyadobacter sp. CY345 TaxID=2909335 RepID=UPI001F3F5E51|nr:response regulator [Dyadobacter sp. CY345]MCF2447005.1 response regulator [Dyadobacter sp. CY345]
MNKNGDIILIEDDEDDQYLLEQAFESLGYPNKRRYFLNGLDALDYLHSTKDLPFLILSDINMPILNGFELRNKLHVDAELSLKCIPYLFFSTAISQQIVIEAYSTSAQGFFVKQTSYEELVETLRVIVDYWKKCAAPNNF